MIVNVKPCVALEQIMREARTVALTYGADSIAAEHVVLAVMTSEYRHYGQRVEGYRVLEIITKQCGITIDRLKQDMQALMPATLFEPDQVADINLQMTPALTCALEYAQDFYIRLGFADKVHTAHVLAAILHTSHQNIFSRVMASHGISSAHFDEYIMF